MLVVFEGPDGAGKTSISNKLSNLEYLTTKEPGSPNVMICRWVKRLITFCKGHGLDFVVGPLFFIDHFFHWLFFLNWHKDQLVICDRLYGISNNIYREGIIKSFVEPDVIFYFKVDSAIAAQRILNRSNIPASDTAEFLKVKSIIDKVSDEYEQFFHKRLTDYTQVRLGFKFYTVDANQSEENIFREIKQEL
jgi:thymidylate kinase